MVGTEGSTHLWQHRTVSSVRQASASLVPECDRQFAGRRVAVLEGGFGGWESQRLPAGSLSQHEGKAAVLQGVCARGVSRCVPACHSRPGMRLRCLLARAFQSVAREHVSAGRLQVVYEQRMDADGQVGCTYMILHELVGVQLRPHVSAKTV